MSKKYGIADLTGLAYSTVKNILAHERLAIVDPQSGQQP
jgi:asparagine synthetase B (glutamine-hydrolysing)